MDDLKISHISKNLVEDLIKKPNDKLGMTLDYRKKSKRLSNFMSTMK